MAHRRRSLLSRRPKAGEPPPVAEGALDPTDAPEVPRGFVPAGDPPPPEPVSPDPAPSGPVDNGALRLEVAPPAPKYTPHHRMLTRGHRPPKVSPRMDPVEWIAVRVVVYAGLLFVLAMVVGATALFLLRHEWIPLLGL